MFLDLADRATGWAVGYPGKPETSGVIHPRGGGETNIWLSTTGDLKELCRKYEVGQVFFAEFVHAPYVLAARVNFGLRALVMVELGRLGIHVLPIPEISYRKAMGVDLSKKPTAAEQADFDRRVAKWHSRKRGKGKRDGMPRPKRDMKARVAAALAEYGLNFEDDNERDAVLMLMAHKKVKTPA